MVENTPRLPYSRIRPRAENTPDALSQKGLRNKHSPSLLHPSYTPGIRSYSVFATLQPVSRGLKDTVMHARLPYFVSNI